MAFAVQIAKGIKGIFDLVRDDLALVEQEIAGAERRRDRAGRGNFELPARGRRQAAAAGAAAAERGRGGLSRRRARSGWARWWR